MTAVVCGIPEEREGSEGLLGVVDGTSEDFEVLRKERDD